eukprot:TRINITY_DN4706_c0_g1_i2.p1 TRINITY_DN4706_c0_g1~~TRINITY_DN4706_c0_g1_i2.p1  ORF type:complete len:104 (+),score=17.23 TRINITY_DN4706_c0_g1_i2:66-377(+)
MCIRDRYGTTPEFSNQIETRFDWGVIDLNVKVEQNRIVDAKVYSDCLFPDFISKMNEILQGGTITYDKQGIDKLREELIVAHLNHAQVVPMIEQFSTWAKSAL